VSKILEVHQYQQVLNQLNSRVEEAQAGRDDAARSAKLAIIGLSVVTTVSLLGVVIALRTLPLERYLYSDNAKVVCDAQLKDDPLVTTTTVTEFAKDCILDMDTFAYDSVERDLSRMADKCFTPEFRKTFFQAPWLADRITTVRDGFLRVNAQTTGPVLVASSGPTAVGYQWKVELPVKRSYRQGDVVKGSNNRTYRVTVYRVVRNAFNPVGLGINSVEEISQ